MNNDNHSPYLAFNEDELRIIFAQLGEWRMTAIDIPNRNSEVSEVEAIRSRINDFLIGDQNEQQTS